MSRAAHYAHALFALVEKDPSKCAIYLKNLNEVLKRRGHEKLLPNIFSEYRSLEISRERSKMHATFTPEHERTRVLLALYRKLITTA